MSNYALFHTLCPVVPQVENNTNNQASQPHVMGETKKQNSDNKRGPGKSTYLNTLPITPNKNPDQKAPCEQLLNKGGNENSPKEFHKQEETCRRGKLGLGKTDRDENPEQKYDQADKE